MGSERRPWLLAGRERRDGELDDGEGEQRLQHVTGREEHLTGG